MEPLSDEWLAELGEAIADVEVDADVDLTIDYCAGTRAFRLVIAGGTVGIVGDPEGDAEIRISTTPSMAAEIRRGSRAALAGFMTGEVVVGGDLTKLIAHHEVLESLGPAFRRVGTD